MDIMRETFYFKEGILQVPDHFLNKSLLQYGIDERGIDPLISIDHPYIVYLEDLSFISWFTIPLIYVNIDDNTKARRTISGGLKVKRISKSRKGLKKTSTFSREEYEVIRSFFDSAQKEKL